MDRISNSKEKPDHKKKRLAELQESLVKVKLQTATCELLKGHKKEADRLMRGVTKFTINHQYNLALYRAAQSDKDATLKALQAFVDNRKSIKARNQSRDFIETEPLFKKFTDTDEDFKKLCKREAEKEATKKEDKKPAKE